MLRSIFLASLSLALASAQAEPPKTGKDLYRATYTKYEYRIAMRDGKKLFTAVYVPKDSSRPYPILLMRTPYGLRPYGPDHYPEALGPSDDFVNAGYIFALQDVRGRYMSEGEFVNVRPHKPSKRGPEDVDESTDTWDTIEWLVKNVPGSNGKAGLWGISYPGFYATMGIVDAHPALVAASPQAPVADWFIGDDFHHNGAFYLPHAFRWLWQNGRVFPEPAEKIAVEPFDHKSPDGYDFYLRLGTIAALEEKLLAGQVPFWLDIMKHGTYDQFWQERDVRRHLQKVRPAVLTVGGWFDAENLFGALETYRAIERHNRGTYNVLVMGPWRHGGWSGREKGTSLGSVLFHVETGDFYRKNILLPFFEHFLKAKDDPKLPEAFVFETGANQWRRYPEWPPRQAGWTTLYFHEGGRLAFEPPATDSGEAFDEYLSDPAKPVPFVPYITTGMTREHMLDDQRFAATRPDVLVYQTGVLENDLTLAGPVAPSLWVSTSGTDSDWVVKLIDVYPGDFPDPEPNPAGIRMGGYQQLVRGEVMRGKFRASFEKPEPLVPGQVTRIEYSMPDIFHTFRKGHRVMVHLQSTWFPLVDRNPQKFMDIYSAKQTDFQKATQRAYRSRRHPSAVRVSVLGR